MRIESKHVYTGGLIPPKGVEVPKLTKTFEKGAPINMSFRPLTNRVTQGKTTERGKELSKKVGGILKQIPTPFLKKGASPSGS